MQVQISLNESRDIDGVEVFVTDIADGDTEATIAMVGESHGHNDELLVAEGDMLPIGTVKWEVGSITNEGVVTLMSVASVE